MSQIAAAFDMAARVRVVEALAAALREHYVFPELAERMADNLQARGRRGEYDEVGTALEFCTVLTAHMQEVSRDKHLRIHYSADGAPPADAEQEEDGEEQRRDIVFRNFGIERVERLAGNIGYLNLTGFYPAAIAGHAAVAAMGLLANTNALIVDLQSNGGGEPEMVALLASYLFDEPTHLNDLYWRDGDTTQQSWSLAYVPGPRLGGAKPVYVLVGPRTASGAEEYAYDLQTRKRATIVGETTAGAAHPGGGFPLDANFGVFIPTGRAINPITGTDWEGTGIIPDVAVPVAQALEVAHAAALRAILDYTPLPGAGSLKGVLARNGRGQGLHEEAREALARLESSTALSAGTDVEARV